jgi:hypothetical protein
LELAGRIVLLQSRDRRSDARVQLRKQAAAITEPSAVAPDARVNFGIKPIG